ncbi:MAG: decaprenyl-phosphate phosphoribosyltransferase [Phycisphaerae bacterium]|nr:decaprenyl-phosphate phosphoribosyltransferase [Phycisphaerae bacterium]
MSYLQLLRPAQWTKNLFVFAGLIFGQKINEPRSVLVVLLGFICFCLVSSAVYIINDIHDRNEDRLHPVKRRRPLAAGQITVTAASLLAVILLVVGLGGGFILDRGFFLVASAYLLLQVAYTLHLKHVAILDVILLGLGFVLRAVAGVVVLDGVELSPWLVLCTFTLCLFMGFSKRRCELNVLAGNGNNNAASHRKTLAEYTPDLLNHMTTLTAGIAVVSFTLYAMDQRTLDEFGTNYLLYTLPLVVYAIFRFALLVEHGRVNGPTEVLLRDRPFQAAIGLWGIAALLIVYHGRALQEWLSRF